MMNVMEKYEGTIKEVKDDVISFDLSEEMMEKLSIKPVSTIYDTYNYDIFDFAKSKSRNRSKMVSLSERLLLLNSTVSLSLLMDSIVL